MDVYAKNAAGLPGTGAAAGRAVMPGAANAVSSGTGVSRRSRGTIRASWTQASCTRSAGSVTHHLPQLTVSGDTWSPSYRRAAQMKLVTGASAHATESWPHAFRSFVRSARVAGTSASASATQKQAFWYG